MDVRGYFDQRLVALRGPPYLMRGTDKPSNSGHLELPWGRTRHDPPLRATGRVRRNEGLGAVVLLFTMNSAHESFL